MSDTISRQDAIDALEREKTYSTVYKDGYTQTDYFKQYNMGLTDGIKALNKLPSIQPERKSGKWVWNEDGVDWGLGAWCCSECGRKPETWWESDESNNPLNFAGSRFCGNCGADMRSNYGD